MRPFGLTYVPYFILLLLAATAPRRPSELATELRLDSSSLTGHLDRLVDGGLVKRRPDPDDRRSTLIELTPGGRERIAAMEELGVALRDLDPDVAGNGDPAAKAQQALTEIGEAVRHVSDAFARVDRAAQSSVDALGALHAAAKRAAPRRRGPAMLRIATMTAADSGGGRALRRFADLVRERTDGAVRVETVIPYREAGGELQLLVDLRAGRLALVGVTAAVAGTLVSIAQALELPYLFESRGHARRALDGPLGRELLAAIAEHGVLGLGIAANGIRSLTTRDVLVRTPAQMHGMRLRTQQAPVNVYFAESLGAIAVPLPYERLKEALRDGDVDAQENALANVVDCALWEEQRHLILTEHTHSCLVLLGNVAAFAALGTHADRVRDALADAISETAADGERYDREAIETLQTRMLVTRLTSGERARFVAQTQLAAERVARSLGDVTFARVRAAVDAARHSTSSSLTALAR